MDGGESMRMPVIAIITFAFSILVSGCYSKVDFDEVIGSYKLRYPYGTEELRLSKEGTYTQTILIDGETTAKINKGQWEFDREESKVILKDAVIVDDVFGHLKPDYWKIERGLWDLSARKSFGRVSLGVNSDLGFAFKKNSEKKE
jgi:hypothetical protein